MVVRPTIESPHRGSFRKNELFVRLPGVRAVRSVTQPKHDSRRSGVYRPAGTTRDRLTGQPASWHLELDIRSDIGARSGIGWSALRRGASTLRAVHAEPQLLTARRRAGRNGRMP